MNREQLEKEYGAVMDTNELQEKYTVIGFSTPYVVVKDKDTGEKGSLQFQHMPRFYFGYVKD